MQETSQSLLERLRQQPVEEDWSRLVSLYEPFIARYIRLDSHLVAEADDISQEVLKRVVEHLPRFERRREGSFRTWLKTITVNEVNRYWRNRYGRRDSPRSSQTHLLEALTDPKSELSRQWDREHGEYVLQRLLADVERDFAPATWEAFRMRVFERLTTADVAARLSISTNAVDIAKSRVLSRLRQEAHGFID